MGDLPVKLGDDTIVLVTRTGSGQYDDRGNEIETPSYTVVEWCSVTPATSTESVDRTVPRVQGLDLLAPSGAGIDAADAVIWPATSTGDPDQPWTGPQHEVDGDVGVWEDCEQARLRRAS